MITDRQLAAIMPNLSEGKRQLYLPFLNDAMIEFGIDSPVRIAAFLAQLAHESGELKYWSEIWGPTDAQKRYEGRKDLGNTQPGDGFRFRGRGPIQVTGRANYTSVGKSLGIDCVNHPELLEQPQHGFRAAGLYWKSHQLNVLADQQTEAGFKEITRRINGGLNGYADRVKYYQRAVKAMRDAEPEVAPILPSIEPEPSSQVIVAVQPQPQIVPVAVPAPETPHTSDSAKSVRAGVGASAIVAGLTAAGKWLGAHSNDVMVACICITALALVFMFRQLILAAIREWLKGQNINV